MGIEISGNNGRPRNEAVETGQSKAATPANQSKTGSNAKLPPSGGGDQLQLSSQAAQLQALESEIASLPVVDTQRVQDVQRTLATGSFQIEPASVAEKILNFEAGLSKAE